MLKLRNYKQLIKSTSVVLNLRRFVSCENDIIEKWGKKFAEENVSEVESSIKHILNHIVGRNVVGIYE